MTEGRGQGEPAASSPDPSSLQHFSPSFPTTSRVQGTPTAWEDWEAEGKGGPSTPSLPCVILLDYLSVMVSCGHGGGPPLSLLSYPHLDSAPE